MGKKKLTGAVVVGGLVAGAAYYLWKSFKNRPKQLARGQARMTFIGHATVKIRTSNGTVIYIDPYFKGDYSEKADLVIITHEHDDHNRLELVTLNDNAVVLRAKDMLTLVDGEQVFKTKMVRDVSVAARPACNENHAIDACMGVLLSFDGLRIYHAGDTGYVDSMAELKDHAIDYALLPIDGEYNMDAKEAMKCAETIGAKHNVPIHWLHADPKAFVPDNLLFMAQGETITL